MAQQTAAEVVLLGSDEQRAAFVDFYERAGSPVFRALAVTLGDQELARDATQEAMTRAWRTWDEVGAYANPAGWVPGGAELGPFAAAASLA